MIKGTYIYYENGKEIYRSSNVITKFGKRFFTEFISGEITASSKDICIGIDSTAATENDTRLGFEYYRTPVNLSSTDIQTVDSVTTYSVVYRAILPQDLSGTISEIGLYPSTRTSLNNYDSKFLSDFSNALDWVDVNNFYPTTVLSNAKIGDSMLKLSSTEYTSNVFLDLEGYSSNDTVRVAYYKNNTSSGNIVIRLYTSDTDYYQYSFASQNTVGYHISSNIPITDLFGVGLGSPDKSQIVKIGISKTESADIDVDAIRINDEDTFDPSFGLISRSVPTTPLQKLFGRQVDIEYRLDLSF
jgi:Flp pilus assembly protein TadG